MGAHLCPKCGENTIYFDGICHSCRQKQRRDEILNLSADEVEAMILKIADRIGEIEKWQEIYNDFWALFSLRDIHDPRIARAAVAAEIYCPPELYFGAPKDVRDALVRRLASLQDNAKNTLNDLLCALAWQGDEQTTQLFYELYQNPRPWRQKLYAGTEIYAQIGGWSFDRTGERKSLVFDKCLTAVRVKNGADENRELANSGVNLNASSASARNSSVNIDFDEMPSFGQSGGQDGEEIDGESKFSAEHDLAEVRRAAQDAPQKQKFKGQNLDDVIAGGGAPETYAHKNLAGTPQGVKDTSRGTKGARQGEEGVSQSAGSAQRMDVPNFERVDGDEPPFEAQEDEAKFKPAPPLNIEEMGIPKINEANRLDDDDAPLDL